MSRGVRFEPEAADELDEAALWYEKRRRGLGLEFLNTVDHTVRMISAWPKVAPRVIDLPKGLQVRRVLVPQFPYHLVYLETPGAIRILAVAHDAKRPGYWLERLPD